MEALWVLSQQATTRLGSLSTQKQAQPTPLHLLALPAWQPSAGPELSPQAARLPQCLH